MANAFGHGDGGAGGRRHTLHPKVGNPPTDAKGEGKSFARTLVVTRYGPAAPPDYPDRTDSTGHRAESLRCTKQ
jgi:hypothetical protein